MPQTTCKPNQVAGRLSPALGLSPGSCSPHRDFPELPRHFPRLRSSSCSCSVHRAHPDRPATCRTGRETQLPQFTRHMHVAALDKACICPQTWLNIGAAGDGRRWSGPVSSLGWAMLSIPPRPGILLPTSAFALCSSPTTSPLSPSPALLKRCLRPLHSAGLHRCVRGCAVSYFSMIKQRLQLFF